MYEPLRSTRFCFETTHLMIIMITFVFQLYFHSLKFLKALLLMLLLSLISNKKILFIFSTNKVAAEEVP